jgi:hypothetical protein
MSKCLPSEISRSTARSNSTGAGVAALPARRIVMSTTVPDGSGDDGLDVSFDCILLPCETYDGSRHETICLGDEVEVDDEEPASTKTVLMSAALLAQLRTELLAQALRDPPHERPTRPRMPAVRPNGRSGRS